jgi:hypothetical protein
MFNVISKCIVIFVMFVEYLLDFLCMTKNKCNLCDLVFMSKYTAGSTLLFHRFLSFGQDIWLVFGTLMKISAGL